MSKNYLFQGARAAWMRRNPCGLHCWARGCGDAPHLAWMRCRGLREKRKAVIEDRLWGELKQFHREVLQNLPALTL